MEKSESIKEIAIALSKFQGESLNPKNTALNATRQGLSKYGLSIVQDPYTEGENIIVETFLLHTSGKWIKSPPLPARLNSGYGYKKDYRLKNSLDGYFLVYNP